MQPMPKKEALSWSNKRRCFHKAVLPTSRLECCLRPGWRYFPWSTATHVPCLLIQGALFMEQPATHDLQHKSCSTKTGNLVLRKLPFPLFMMQPAIYDLMHKPRTAPTSIFILRVWCCLSILHTAPCSCAPPLPSSHCRCTHRTAIATITLPFHHCSAVALIGLPLHSLHCAMHPSHCRHAHCPQRIFTNAKKCKK
eukprot:1161506-Pelagomonas_calceolata.AAC.3